MSFVREIYDSENRHCYHGPRSGKFVRDTNAQIFPSITKRHLPDWIDDLPDNTLKTVMTETYRAFNTDSHYLAAFGSRTMIDRLIILTVGDQGTFQNGLKKLEHEQKISDFERLQIDPVVEAGHAAAHRGWSPEEQQLTTMLDTVEGLIYRLLVLPKLSEELRESLPARPPKKPSKSTQENPKSMSGIVTAEQKIALATGSLKKLFEQLKSTLKAFDENISMHHKKHYTVFRRNRNFASVQLYLQKQEIKIYLNIDPDEIELEDGFSRDVRAIGHFGTGDLEIVIKKPEDIEKAQELLKKSYLSS